MWDEILFILTQSQNAIESFFFINLTTETGWIDFRVFDPSEWKCFYPWSDVGHIPRPA